MHGRHDELAAVARLLADGRAGRGAALVVRGQAGIGKSVLLSAARRCATDAGMLVLAASGAEAESALPFAGLHQLLAPLLDDLSSLTPRLRGTLRGAFGQEGTRPDLFTIGLSVLELLGERAARTPLLIVAEDAHWLDPETLDVLVFVARRLAVEPIVAIMAVRAPHADVLAGGGIGQLHLDALDDDAAGRVLADHAPGLPPGLRNRILAEAAGNPLALVELPRCVTSGSLDELPELLPLNERLESAFATQAAQHARGVAANAAGHHDEALDLLVRTFDPQDVTFHLDMSGWALPDLADAAVRSGRQDEIRGIVARAAQRAARFPSPMLHHSLAYAVAVLAPEREAGARFAEAFALDLGAWPVHRARLNLAYGAWLRRRRHILESRVPLRIARDGFEALGAAAWGRLAREELRAAGEESAGRAVPSREQLTAQELQTAMLAAAGLSNREIGQRLFVSHRTVSSHLYRIFPKLGITARSQLREALAALPHGAG
ncbi:AAA family ATPase [Micromonospora sp. DH15]|nr:AAA family ATPase [Micromonospora sp. DH15]